MLRGLTIWAAALGAIASLAAAPALAKDLTFTADLSGNNASTMTGSKAVGHAQILVDTDAQTVSVSMDVEGLKTGDLWARLAATPLGPIHLHIYGGHDHSGGAESKLLFPLPYGPAYAPTAKGFHVEVKGAPYAAGAASVNSKASFDDFVSALQAGRIVLNIHTNSHNDGEISGDVVPAA